MPELQQFPDKGEVDALICSKGKEKNENQVKTGKSFQEEFPSKEIKQMKYPFIEQGKIQTVIWDWNGTLLDDVEVNRKIINAMLLRRELKPLDEAAYKDSFCFPVQLFQRRVGFNFEEESVEEISAEYHRSYKIYEKEIRLNVDALSVLNALHARKINQYILSAAAKDDLIKMLNAFDLQDKFVGIYGATDICASGKIAIGKCLMQTHLPNPDTTLLVGDTVHDAEVAESLGIACVLYAGGHNSRDMLSEKAVVVTQLNDLLSFI